MGRRCPGPMPCTSRIREQVHLATALASSLACCQTWAFSALLGSRTCGASTARHQWVTELSSWKCQVNGLVLPWLPSIQHSCLWKQVLLLFIPSVFGLSHSSLTLFSVLPGFFLTQSPSPVEPEHVAFVLPAARIPTVHIGRCLCISSL